MTAILPLLAALPWLATSMTFSSTSHLNISVSAAEHGRSVLQCWQLSTPPTTAAIGDATFASESLGGLQSGSVNIFPPGLDLGLHVAPRKQWTIVLAGSIKVYLPERQSQADTAFITAGLNSVLFSADTADVSSGGHVTKTIEQTMLLFLPTANGTEPAHMVLHNGPCAGQDLMS